MQHAKCETKPTLAPANLVDLIDSSMQGAMRAGICMLTADDTPCSGRAVHVDGTPLLNFGSCSYLGLEMRTELKKGAVDATERFGTQFSMARVCIQSPLYRDLEAALECMTGGHVVVAASTTLAHIAALPVLIEPGDAVLVDHFAHASLHTALALLKSNVVEPVRHNRVDLVAQRVEKLARDRARIWYVIDGVYSMHGDFAPLDRIEALMERQPRLHLYADDAHATSWIGKYGRGRTLDLLKDRARVVVALSLNKAFSAAGGALVLPTSELRDKVRRCGAPLLFSGPIQPPMLGAAVASARLHLDAELTSLQQELARRISLTLRLGHDLGIPFASDDPTPLFFVPCGSAETTFEIARSLRSGGVYVVPTVFPAVPIRTGGIRFTIGLHNREEDIDVLMRLLSAELKRHHISMNRPGVGESEVRSEHP